MRGSRKFCQGDTTPRGGGGHFWGFKILNSNIFGGFQKNEYFWGYEDFVDIF